MSTETVLDSSKLERMWAEVEKEIETHEGVFIRFNWADMNGIPRGFAVPARNAKSIFFEGLSAAYGNTTTSRWDHI